MYPITGGVNYFGANTMRRQMPRPQGLLSAPQGNPMQGAMPPQAQGMPQPAMNNMQSMGGGYSQAQAPMQGMGAAMGANPYAQNSMMGGQFQGGGMNSMMGGFGANPFSAFGSQMTGMGAGGGFGYGSNPYASQFAGQFASMGVPGYGMSTPQMPATGQGAGGVNPYAGQFANQFAGMFGQGGGQ